MAIKDLFDAFDQIESTSSKTDKLALLEAIKNRPALDPLAREFFSIAMDWYRIFGVAEKTLAEPTMAEIDAEVFGTPVEKTASSLTPEAYWNSFRNLIGRIEKGGEDKPNKEEIRNFVGGIADDQSKKWITAAILKKPRIGCSEKTVNKVWPKLINYFEVQLADVLEAPNDLFADTIERPAKVTKTFEKKLAALPKDYWVEPKLDGIRAVCRVNPKAGTVKFFSRGGQVLNNTAPAGINDFLLRMCNEEVIFDGELYGRNWNETTKVTSKGEGEADPELVKHLRFHVFDMLSAEEWDNQKCDRDYTERREAISFRCMTEDTDDKVVKTVKHAVETPEDIVKLYKSYLAKKFEGVMVKHPHGLYEFKRTSGWLKFKPTLSDEFEVVGKYEGKQHSRLEGTLGGLTIKIKDGLTCDVGSGFSDEQRAEFWANPPIGKVVEVEFMERDKEGMLRFPVFCRVREDRKAELLGDEGLGEG